MDGKELRSGNIVLRKGYLFEDKNFYETIVDFRAIQACICNPNIFKPIPITEEILLELGYKKYGCHYCIQGHRIWLCNDLFVCDKNGTVLKYVHKLQNLYYAINNLELTRKKI